MDGLYLLYWTTTAAIRDEIGANLLDNLLALHEGVVFEIPQCILVALDVVSCRKPWVVPVHLGSVWVSQMWHTWVVGRRCRVDALFSYHIGLCDPDLLLAAKDSSLWR